MKRAAERMVYIETAFRPKTASVCSNPHRLCIEKYNPPAWREPTERTNMYGKEFEHEKAEQTRTPANISVDDLFTV